MSGHHKWADLVRPIREDPVRWARIQEGRRLYDKLESYYHLPYTVEAKRTSEGYFAKVVELPGCMTWSESFEELEAMIEDALTTWIYDALEDGDPIPEPQDISENSKVQERSLKQPGEGFDLGIGEEVTWTRDTDQTDQGHTT